MSEKKHTKQYRGWCFTINNPKVVEDFKIDGATCVAWQLEKGEKGTEHIQGCCYFVNKISFASLKKKIAGSHLEIMKGTWAQAKTYCSKEDSRVRGPWLVGEEPKQSGTPTDRARL